MVVVTLTTIPSRLNSEYTVDIKHCLDSLLNQTYKDYEVHLNIPEIFKYTGEKYYIPEWLIKLEKSNPKFKVFKNLEDLGPVTKLFYTVKRIDNPNHIIIVVDDDLVYRDTLVEEQVKNQQKYIDAVVGYDGLDSVDQFQQDIRDYYCAGVRDTNKVKIIQHYKSVSYKRSYFQEDFYNFILSNLSWNDDLLVSSYFASKRRDRVVTYHESDPIFTDEDEWRAGVGTTFPLKHHTQHERYEGCNLYRKLEIDDKRDDLFKYLDNGYYPDKLDLLQTVIYTNNNSVPLAEIALSEFLYFAPNGFNPLILTNGLPINYTPTHPEAIYNTNVANKGGKQFSEVMLKFLKGINQKYIFLLLDDYITYKKFSKFDFNKLITFMEDNNVDYFSFDKKQARLTEQFNNYKNEIYDDGLLNEISNIDIHRYSVQPCIWNRESFIRLLQKYPDIGIHTLETDETIAKEDLKTIGFNWHILDPKIPITEGFEHHFVYSWAEVVRHGVFHTPENGFSRNYSDLPVQLVYALIKKYSLRENSYFKKLLYNI